MKKTELVKGLQLQSTWTWLANFATAVDSNTSILLLKFTAFLLRQSYNDMT